MRIGAWSSAVCSSALVTALPLSTPALSIVTGGTGPATIVYLAIRGQAQNSPNSFSDASVGIYIDGVYVGRPMVGNLGFLDMASAEVLRGPQGTLFGRNTTGGALNLTTAQPTNKDRKSTRLNSSHQCAARMQSPACNKHTPKKKS